MQRWLIASTACVLALGLGRSAPRVADVDTVPKVVKVPVLIEAIKQHKGNVVVVDCWADG